MLNKTEDNYYAEPDWDTLEKRIEELIDEPDEQIKFKCLPQPKIKSKRLKWSRVWDGF